MKREEKAKLYRQGDVLLERVDIDVKAQPHKIVPRDKGRVVLAYGEVTGHAHAILEAEAELIELETGERFLLVGDAIKLVPSERVIVDEEDVGKSGVIFRHEEHDAHGIPEGTYRVTQQCEYTPQAIRPVAD